MGLQVVFKGIIRVSGCPLNALEDTTNAHSGLQNFYSLGYRLILILSPVLLVVL